ncbi:beta-ketoacyl synthase N-terminal-like domain-containing protein [Nocardia sp. R6R-6]|uniref:beta-ketoacyl synthase N-terminal-like domain-containing protein n=1 Tax=Nocardia sp. R6R-6 TaxID=3459303 RepID=UPI00403DE1CA
MCADPIAIVGRGCVLPGALDPDRLWHNVVTGRTSLTRIPDDRRRLPPAGGHGRLDIGGYVDGFDAVFRSALAEPAFQEIIDPAVVRDTGMGGAGLDDLDPLFRWAVYGAASALRESGQSQRRARTGLVLGNLSFPSVGLVSYAEQVWLAEQDQGVRDRTGPLSARRSRAADRFMSGLPAHLTARALGLGRGGFALDAACASALYAVKLACDTLADGRADLMLAGGVNGVDPLFVHEAFGVLSAMSRSGRSRPFHRQADGLVPGEGAVFVALMRLADAIAADAPIVGVIRGMGLSNDGRDSGLLAPSEDGQARAMRAAYAAAGVPPESVGLLECHATGTRVGDLTEVRSTSRVFADARDLVVGSVKENLGHLLTAAGGAGLLKVLGALGAGVRPASPSTDDPMPEISGTPLRLHGEPAEWTGPRRAAVSAFGFGGTNAHLVVDAWTGDNASAVVPPPRLHPQPGDGRSCEPVAVVAVRVTAADGLAGGDLWRAVMSGASRIETRSTVELAGDGLCFPPADLARAQAQQLLILQTARDAVAGIRLPAERTTVLVGMGCDPEVARPVVRGRVEALAGPAGAAVLTVDGIGAPQTRASVVGSMPNLVANRINAQLGVTGPGFTVSAEEGSGLVALRIAARALRAGESDAAVVGAVDLSREPVHRAALAELGLPDTPGDAAVVVVLKRLTDARADGERVLAVLDDVTGGVPAPSADDRSPDLTVGDADSAMAGVPHLDPSALFGRAHAASGLLAFALAVSAATHRAAPRVGGQAVPFPDPPLVEAAVQTLGGAVVRARLRAADPTAFLRAPAPKATVYSGRTRVEVAAALAAGRPSADGPARLVVLAADAQEHSTRADAARDWLAAGGRRPEGVFFRERPVTGEMAFVFSGGSMAYPGMGRDLMLAFPALLDTVRGRCGALSELVGWAHDTRNPRPRHALDQVWGASVLGQLHAEITRTVLGLRPDAAIGYSSGELTSLAALGVWPDVTPLTRLPDTDPDAFGMAVANELQVVRAAWRKAGIEGTVWMTYQVDTSAERVRAALAGEPAVHLMVINTPDSCVIGGEADGCARVLERLDGVASLPIDYDMPAHVPELSDTTSEWEQLYRLPTNAHTGVRHYTCSTTMPVELSPDSVAVAVTRQQLGPIDFAGTIERAWADGVRIFVEHGPRGLCAAWIRRTLGSREHLVVSLDGADGRGVDSLLRAVAELMAAGVPVDTAALAASLGNGVAGGRAETGTMLSFPAHPPEVRVGTVVAPSAGTSHAAAPEDSHPTSDRSGSELGEHVQLMEPAPIRAGASVHPVHTVAADARLERFAESSTRSAVGPLGSMAVNHRAAAVEHEVAAAAPPDEFVALVAEQLRLAGHAHRSWLGLLADAHVEFLEARGRAAELLSRAGQAIGPDRRHPDTDTGLSGPAVRSAAAALTVVAPVSEPPLPTAPTTSAGLSGPAVRSAAAALTAVAPVSEPPPPTVSTTSVGPVRRRPSGATFDRAQLEALSAGPIAAVLGHEYAAVDSYRRVIRMPSPPLLLPDRVIGMDGEPGTWDGGVIWTETDVPVDGWYLDPAGRMPAGITAEAGQASLLLLSWLGADHLARGARVYRLLGCEVTLHGQLPGPGETLRYEIHIDGQETFGDIPLFTFHSHCFVGDELRLTITRGQAGLFTDAELAGGRGLSWRPEDDVPQSEGTVDPPATPQGRRSFNGAQVAAFAAGAPADCFGSGWELTRSHIRTPRIADGRGRFLHEVAVFDPGGGPWGRGYLRGEFSVRAQDWFFAAHFPGDPCMPGTLMSEGCFQAMAFYLAAAGFTIDRDGWRFEPVTGEPYLMQYRGQVLPTSSGITYEVFVVELHAGPQPTLIADVLCTVDGIKACHGRRLGLRLVPDWPLDSWRELSPPTTQRGGDPLPPQQLAGLVGCTEPTSAARVGEFVFDYRALLGCAWGRPSEAFGPPYAVFDSHRHVARLPGPPFHFMSRVIDLDGPAWELRPGAGAVIEYDVPADVWYFDQNDYPVMPLAVVMEVALQASGWLAAYAGSALDCATDLHFRNLGGTATIHREIGPGDGPLVTRTRLTNVMRDGRTIIEDFTTECLLDSLPVVTLTTTFGFFPKDAFAGQVGIPATPQEAGWRTRDSTFALDLTPRPGRWFRSEPRLPGPMLSMIDRITGYWPDGGAAGLGRLRAEKDVDPGEWFFKAHFFQDPVQPGSLGIQALCQLVQFHAIETGLAAGLRSPRFRSAVPGQPLNWKYRGQVTPLTRTVTLEAEILDITADDTGPYVVAEGWLWADDIRIYHLPSFAVGIAAGDDRVPHESHRDS